LNFVECCHGQIAGLRQFPRRIVLPPSPSGPRDGPVQAPQDEEVKTDHQGPRDGRHGRRSGLRQRREGDLIVPQRTHKLGRGRDLARVGPERIGSIPRSVPVARTAAVRLPVQAITYPIIPDAHLIQDGYISVVVVVVVVLVAVR